MIVIIRKTMMVNTKMVDIKMNMYYDNEDNDDDNDDTQERNNCSLHRRPGREAGEAGPVLL